jgi:hypothetical protein
MIKDRFGVVHQKDREKFEKKYHLPFGYNSVSFSQNVAEDICKKQGAGYVVEKISTGYDRINEREIIYRS